MFTCPYEAKCLEHLAKTNQNLNRDNCSENCVRFLHYKTDQTGTEAVRDFVKSDLFEKIKEM